MKTLVLLVALACACGPRPGVPEPRELASREALDLAIGFLAAGRVEPPLEALSDAALDELAGIVARLVQAYGHADFGAFLALRRGDLASAEHDPRERERELRALCEELGVAPGRDAGWTELLRAYWTAYYAEPPVARFLPEETAAELRAEDVDPGGLGGWEEGFARLRDGLAGARLDHRLAVPHRRPLADVADDPGPLRWIDLTLGFEAHDGVAGRLIARFVWDGATGEWFLHRATTSADGERRDDARFLVL